MKAPVHASKMFLFASFLAAASFAFPRHLLASGDDGCTLVWRPVHHEYEGCSNMAFLSPSNDTRINLLLLLADLRVRGAGLSLKTETPSTVASPLFQWESLVVALGSSQDRAGLQSAGLDTAGGPQPAPVAAPADPFTHALQSDREVGPAERSALLQARLHVQSGSPAGDTTAALAALEKATPSVSARAYATYLGGAAAFWQADYMKATAMFSSLTGAQPVWVRETATYMVGRSLLGRAQEGAFDQYGSFNAHWHADAKVVAGAEAALDRYLQQYPKGAYAQSARGLKRRGYWLAQDTAKLDMAYGTALALPPQERNSSDVELVQEIDNKLVIPTGTYGTPRSSGTESELMRDTQNPLLLATLDLQAMRTGDKVAAGPDSNGIRYDPVSISALQQQKPYFAAAMPLFEYLLAVHAFYVDQQPAEVLRLLPDAARQSSFSYLQFSRQVLRGLALEAAKDRNALGFWRQMLPGATTPYQRPALELAIAYHEERTGELHEVFAPDSPVRYPYLREVLLAKVADPGLLRTEAKNPGVPRHERDLALFTLLYKEATRDQAAAFLNDLAMVPPGAPTQGYLALDNPAGTYFTMSAPAPPEPVPLGIFLHDATDTDFNCPGLRASEEQLVRDADSWTARLCIADFDRLNPGLPYPVPSPSTEDLGDSPSLFPGKEFARMNTYMAVLASTKASRIEKAYALFRAVNCYASSGYNHCGGQDVPVTQRKAWFNTLKHDYPDTRWASALRYYW